METAYFRYLVGMTAILGISMTCVGEGSRGGARAPSVQRRRPPVVRQAAPRPNIAPRPVARRERPAKAAKAAKAAKPAYDKALLAAWRKLGKPTGGKRGTLIGSPRRSVVVDQRIRVTLDRRRQKLKLDVPKEWKLDESFNPLEPTMAAGIKRTGGDGLSLVSASALLAKAKQFDDGLLAAVEDAAARGAGRLPGKNAFLSRLLRLLRADARVGDATVLIAAAARLAGLPVSMSPALATRVSAQLQTFRSKPAAKPMGFYTWSKKLTRAFQRDRLLQTALAPAAGLALARALASSPKLVRTYATLLRVDARLNNPPDHPSLSRIVRALRLKRKPRWPRRSSVSFLPPAWNPEFHLIRRLYGNRPVPAGFQLMDEVVRRVRRGRLSLKPKRNGGWYAHKLYALAPLVRPRKTPEGKRLVFSKTYREVLEHLFKASYALTRETHVKMMSGGGVGGMSASNIIKIELSPSLTVEPLATHYLRQARAYGFVRTVLEKELGKPVLAKLKRRTARGPVNLDLAQELNLMAGLYYGAYLAACSEIGLKPRVKAGLGSGNGPVADQKLFRLWRAGAASDPDVGIDNRMMVPVFYDLGRRKFKVWAVLGVVERDLKIKFSKRPRVVGVQDAEGKRLKLSDGLWSGDSQTMVELKFADEQEEKILVPVFAEVYVSRLLNRTEFRKHCNRYKTKAAILHNLK